VIHRLESGGVTPVRERAEPTNSIETQRTDARPPVAGEDVDYYGVPAIHPPHWKWLIIAYFYLGGISGAAYVIAAIEERGGNRADVYLLRVARYISLAALLPSPVLLILDLGRPKRFFYMLRVLKLRSPMSTGTWGLTAFGAFVTLSALMQAHEDDLLPSAVSQRVPSRMGSQVIAGVGSLLGLFVAGYTGVLLAATAVPLWMKRPLLLGPLFLCSAFSTAAAAIELILTMLPRVDPATRNRLARFESVALLAEMGVLATWLTRLGSTAQPLTSGAESLVIRHGVVGAGMTLPLLLRALAHHREKRLGRQLSSVAAVCVLTGGFALRYAIVNGGQASARNPRFTFDLTRGE